MMKNLYLLLLLTFISAISQAQVSDKTIEVEKDTLKNAVFINTSYVLTKEGNTLNGFSVSNGYLKFLKKNKYLYNSFNFSYNMQSPRRIYPNYFFDRTTISGVTQIMIKNNNNTRPIFFGIGLKASYSFGVMKKDFIMSPNTVVSVTDPSGLVFTVPVTYPYKYRTKASSFTVGPTVSLFKILFNSKKHALNAHINYTYSINSSSNLDLGLGVCIK